MQPCIFPENDHWTCTSPTTPHHTPHTTFKSQCRIAIWAQRRHPPEAFLRAFCTVTVHSRAFRPQTRKASRVPSEPHTTYPFLWFFLFSMFRPSNFRLFYFVKRSIVRARNRRRTLQFQFNYFCVRESQTFRFSSNLTWIRDFRYIKIIETFASIKTEYYNYQYIVFPS